MKKLFFILLLLCFAATSYGCMANKAQQGAVGGTLAGATIGALVSGDKLTGAAVGAGLGLLTGYIIGNEWDKSDQRQLQRTLENSRSGKTTVWRNPDTGARYAATPRPAQVVNNRVYREVEIRDENSGNIIVAEAYRDANGTWRLKQ